MTTSTQASLPDNFGARSIVAGGGALLMVVLAVIVYAITGMWLPTLIIVLLIPVHLLFAITDTNLLESPMTAPVRAGREFQKLFVQGSAQAGPAVSSAWVAPATPGVPPPGAPAPATPTPGAPTAGFPAPGSQTQQPSPMQPATPAPPFPTPQPPAPAPSPTAMPQAGTPPTQPQHVEPPRPAAPAIVHLGPGLSYEAPGPHGPSVVHGFGSYGGHPAADETPADEPSSAFEPPATSPADSPAASSIAPPSETLPQWDDIDSDDLDDPDMTIQRPPRH